jgi:hypothetical protein
VVAALGALGATTMPSLAEASLQLAGSPLGAPSVWDYIGLWRHAPLDQRIEQLAAELGLQVTSRTRIALPFWPLRAPAEGMLIAHLAWGQEAPGRYGSWGWNPLLPATYATGGHSVVLADASSSGWTVLDPNHRRLQRWPRAGVALSSTVIRPA